MKKKLLSVAMGAMLAAGAARSATYELMAFDWPAWPLRLFEADGRMVYSDDPTDFTAIEFRLYLQQMAEVNQPRATMMFIVSQVEASAMPTDWWEFFYGARFGCTNHDGTGITAGCIERII